MKKQVVLALLLAFGFSTFAQTDSTAKRKIEIQIEENTLSFDAEKDMSQGDLSAMIGFATTQASKLQANHKRILSAIAKLESDGKISSEEAEELRERSNENLEENMERFEGIMEQWGESYGERMEAWGEELETRMEAWAEEFEASMENTDSAGTPNIPPVPPIPPMPDMPGMDGKKKKIIISKEGVVIKDGDNETDDIDIEINEEKFNTKELFKELAEKKTKKIKRTEDYLDIALGFNQQLEDGQFLIEDVAGELEFWKSTSFNLGFGWKTRLGSPYSKAYFKYGLDFSWHNFRLSGPGVLNSDNNGSFFDTLNVSNVYEKNKYHIAYFNIPVMLQLDFSDAGDRDEKFTLGVGGYGGVRLLAKRELEYSTPNFESIEEKAYDDFFTNQFRYGVMAQVGFGSFKITASYDLNEFFRPNKGPGSYNMANVTLGFTL